MGVRAGGQLGAGKETWTSGEYRGGMWSFGHRYPPDPSSSCLKAPSALVMAARQALSEVVPQEMRDRGAERPTEL